jgi:tetratricopeptide (TPR) repeat protein
MGTSRDIKNLVNLLVKKNKFSDAEDILLEEINKEPLSVYLLNQLANLYIRMLRYPEAESIIEKSLSLDPGNVYTLMTKGDIFAARKNYSRALEVYSDIEGSEVKDLARVNLYKRMAKVLRISGSPDRALHYAREAAEKDPGSAYGFYLLFQIYRDLNNFALARESIDRAIQIEPHNSFYNRERLALRVMEKGLASDDIRETIDHSEENPQMIELLADQLKKEKKFSEAAAVYEGLVRFGLDSFKRKNLAFLYYHAHDFDKAFENFMMADDSEFLNNVFISSITSSARTRDKKVELLERLNLLVKKPAYRKLWGKIKKIQKELSLEENEKSS